MRNAKSHIGHKIFLKIFKKVFRREKSNKAGLPLLKEETKATATLGGYHAIQTKEAAKIAGGGFPD